jgi:hypothetical protein
MSKSISSGLLAFAVAASLSAQDNTMGWSGGPGSGLTYTGGDAFGVNILSFVQASWSFANNEDAPDISTFDLPAARMQLRGHAFNRHITYRLQLDFAEEGGGTLTDEDGTATGEFIGDSIVKDAYAQYNFSHSEEGRVGVRFGQGKTMFGLESTGWVHGLWFVDRSLASQALSVARSRGAWIVGSVMERERPLRYALGVMNGDVSQAVGFGGEETANVDNELNYVASANWDIMGDFFGGEQTAEYWRQGDFRTDNTDLRGTIGVGVALGNNRLGGPGTGDGVDVDSLSLNLNTAWTVNNVNLLGEFFTRSDDVDVPGGPETEPMGWAISGGYLLPKSGDSSLQWGLGLRVSMVDTDGGFGAGTLNSLAGINGDVMEVSAVGNAFYHGHACKTQIQYTFQDVDPNVNDSATNHIFSVLFQLTF